MNTETKEQQSELELLRPTEHCELIAKETAEMALIGPYQILEKIGSGGMGIVYKVRHKGAGNILALKMLRQELANDPVNVKRFQQELKTTSTLNHPNIVPIYDSGTEVGCPFFVMEYLDGFTLDEILMEEGYLDLERFFSVFGQVCEALAHAHEKRVIHRDLKPSNIMLCASESGVEIAKLLDFGIARVFQQASKDGVRLTQLGEILGSPAYMSPEQCLTQKLDDRSDIYSLGVVMYEALAGVTPFKGDSAAHIIMGHLQDRPKSISHLRPDFNIPPDLELLVMTCLEKDAQLRYQSVAALHDELKRISASMRGRSLGARISTACRHMRVRSFRSVRRIINARRSWAPSAVLSAALITGAAIFYQSQIKSPTMQTYIDRADLAIVHQHYDEVEGNWAEALNLAVKSNMPKDKLSELYERAGDDLIARCYYQVPLNQPVGPITLVEKEPLNQANVTNQSRQSAETFYERALQTLSPEATPEKKIRLLIKTYSVGADASNNGKEKYLDMIRSLVTKDSGKNPQLLLQLAAAYKSRGKVSEAIDLLKQGIPEQNCLLILASIYEETGDTAAAISTWKKVIPSNNPTDAMAHLAGLYENAKDFFSAIKMRKACIMKLKELATTNNCYYGDQIGHQLAALAADEDQLGHTETASRLLREARIMTCLDLRTDL
jgi:serine/threonine protein kinase